MNFNAKKGATAQTKNDNGETVTAVVGRAVSFKCDVEQSAEVQAIRVTESWPHRTQVLIDIEYGEYAEQGVWWNLADCWVE